MTQMLDHHDAGDAIVVGAGLAGALAVLKLDGLRVTWVATRGDGDESSSAYAQGGIAVAIGADDDPTLHLADTLAAGAGLVDEAAARAMVEAGPDRVQELIAWGVPFDRDDQGNLALGREAAHSRRRIVHAGGDRTGAVLMRHLAPRAAAHPLVRVLSGAMAENLIGDGHAITGVVVRQGDKRLVLRAPRVLLATGGIGALYRVTTNPLDSAGEGLGMAARAGALIADPEFVQFHPTALDINRDPAPLASEALRGEGAHLIDETGARFVFSHHPDGELAPRDVVARAIWSHVGQGHQVFLDTRQALGLSVAERFPTVFAAAMASGLDPRLVPLPVAPAAHYHMGGIATDLDARTSLNGLWAAGEVAATGFHGANRLASNSLLEALVTGAAAAHSMAATSGRKITALRDLEPTTGVLDPIVTARLRALMSQHAGGLRSAEGLSQGLNQLTVIEAEARPSSRLANRIAAMRLILTAALRRCESRGAHARADYPGLASQAARSFLTLAETMEAPALPKKRALR